MRILATAALAVTTAACARPVVFEPAGPGASVRPIAVSAQNIRIDVGNVESPVDLVAALAVFSSELEIDEPGGRPYRAVVRIEDYNAVNEYFRAFSQLNSQDSMSGRVELQDLSTGATVFVSEPISVDGRSTFYNKDSAVITRNVHTASADALSKLFMTRARQTLLTTNN